MFPVILPHPSLFKEVQSRLVLFLHNVTDLCRHALNIVDAWLEGIVQGGVLSRPSDTVGMLVPLL